MGFGVWGLGFRVQGLGFGVLVGAERMLPAVGVRTHPCGQNGGRMDPLPQPVCAGASSGSPPAPCPLAHPPAARLCIEGGRRAGGRAGGCVGAWVRGCVLGELGALGAWARAERGHGPALLQRM